MSDDLRIASSSYTSEKSGDVSIHYWVEIEPDTWLEVSRHPTMNEAAEFRRHQRLRELEKGFKPLRLDTRFIRRFSDPGSVVFWPESSNDGAPK